MYIIIDAGKLIYTSLKINPNCLTYQLNFDHPFI
tara:strand:- start:7124 stop:7225 length:102 start_codon:yes stop_codon:yes gene_type:complete